MQGRLSVFAGALLLLMLIFRSRFFSTGTVFQSVRVRNLFGRLMKSPGHSSLFTLGLLMGIPFVSPDLGGEMCH